MDGRLSTQIVGNLMATNPFQTEDGESTIDPALLKDKTTRSRAELRIAEAQNILKADQKHLAVKVTPARAPFDRV